MAVRVWASSDFAKVWLSPEGHVLHVDAAADIITVADESGRPVPVSVDANTQFFFRTPQDAQADATPIATGTGFLAAHNLARGFKVHVSAVDPLATPLVAQSIDIETAAYSGRISGADDSGFTYTRHFVRASDDYCGDPELHRRGHCQWQRCQWQPDHRLQVVELHLPDARRERHQRGGGFRHRHATGR